MLKYLKFDYTVIISLLGKGEWYELFLQQEESENYAGVIAGLLILAMVITTVFSV